MLIDPEACKTREVMEETLVHECVHNESHRLYFTLQRLNNDRVEYLACIDSRYREDAPDEKYEEELRRGQEEFDPVPIKRKDGTFEMKRESEWVEYQARTMARMIKMPRMQTRKKVMELIRQYTDGQRSDLEVMEEVIRELRLFYSVTDDTARRRLLDLGYNAAWGTGIEIDGGKVPPFKMSDGSAPRSITYVITEKNVMWMLGADETFRKEITSRSYLFLENHIVVNSRKYVDGDRRFCKLFICCRRRLW